MKKLTTEQFKSKIYDLVGYEYSILGEYINNKTKILIRHNKCNNEYEVKPNDFQQGYRCPKCFSTLKKSTKQFKQEVYDLVGDEYTVLGEYINCRTKILMRHNTCGNEYEVRPNDFISSSRRCFKCSNKAKKNTKIFKKEVYNLVKDEYTVLGEYKNCRTKILMRHNTCGNEYEVRPNDFISSNNRCPQCANCGPSNKEKELLEFIKSFYSKEIIANSRDIIFPYELDLYFPENNLAIEFNGNYWHGEIGSKGRCDRNYHANKTKLCREKDIQLLHIIESEWDNKQEILKDKIRYLLKDNSCFRAYARECKVVEVDPKTKRNFLNENHIQGNDRSNIYLGLEINKLLVAIMTFGIGNANRGSTSLELSRYTTLLNHSVIGGFSKLFKYFLKNYDLKEFNNIYTYADLRYSYGNLYEKTGWINVGYVNPDYYYTKNGNELFHKSLFKKINIKKKLPEFYNPDLTEREMMINAGYDRIWDAGKIKYKWEKII